MDRDAGNLTGGVEPGDVGAALGVGLDAAHRVVVAGLDVDRLLGDVHAGEVAAHQDDLAERLVDALSRHDGDVERDRAVREAAALLDLRLLGAGDDVARGELHFVGRVALHEALAVGVEEMRALAACSLRDQEALARQGRRVVLDHLHVHQLRPDAVGLGDSVTGADQGVRRRMPDLAVAPGRQDHRLRPEVLHRAVADVPADRADAVAVVVEGEAGREPLLVAGDVLGELHELLVEDMHDRLARDVRDVVGARGRGPAEGAGAELALLVAMEGHPKVLEVEQLVRRRLAHDLDRVLVGQVVRALDGVEGVRLPAVVLLQRRVDPALGGVRMRADRVDLAHDPHRNALLGSRERGPLSREASPDNQDVMVRHMSRSYSKASSSGPGLVAARDSCRRCPAPWDAGLFRSRRSSAPRGCGRPRRWRSGPRGGAVPRCRGRIRADRPL